MVTLNLADPLAMIAFYRQIGLEWVMVRVITQILIGLMLIFGVITLGYRVFFYIAKGNILRALYFLLPCSIALFFAVLAFYYAYSGIMEIWK